jgi:hypothetical protein
LSNVFKALLCVISMCYFKFLLFQTICVNTYLTRTLAPDVFFTMVKDVSTRKDQKYFKIVT